MMMKRVLALLLSVLFVLSFAACAAEPEFTPDSENAIGESGDPSQTWAIYWYLCGSDLESGYGAGTADLEEMMQVELPENVRVIIETGGAWQWNDTAIDPEKNQRFLYSSEGLELLDEKPSQNMGDPETLADFLYYCRENHPADRTMALIWDHGGGSVAGAACDERHDYDTLTLSEFYEAFHSVYELSEEDPPFDLIGFDACLMATVDTAYAFSDVARYLVASEEWEPGGGWLYSGWLQALADDPGMDGARLGQMICDSYAVGCDACGVGDSITLSVVDLSRMAPLMKAYEGFGAEALTVALENPGFFSQFGREAQRSENYGGNTRDQGYANMVDLGHLAANCEGILPETSGRVLSALSDCVLYQVSGPYRGNASGLSCYYSYNGSPDDFMGYLQQGCSASFKYLFGYGLSGEIPQEGMDYVKSLGYEDEVLPEVPDLEEDGDDEYPLYFDEEDYVTLELAPEIVDMLKGVYFELAYIDPEEDLILMLGQDNDIDADWDNGIFRDNFRGVWGALDDHLVYMEVAFEDEDFTGFSVPILLNDEDYNLQVVYDYNDEEFHILGARQELGESGMADKNLRKLEPGDEITTIHYASSISGDDDFEAVPVETFTVTEETRFHEVDMGDGIFLMMFELADSKGNTAYSQAVQITVTGEDMEIEILD